MTLRIQLHFASLARYVCPPKVHQSGLNQWSGGGLTGSTINQVGKQDWFQPGFFKELLLDPQTMQPGTLMPPLFLNRKKMDEEVEQIWTYLKEIDQRRLPDGLLKTERFELIPSDEPIVFRTFLEGAGMQSIAVGFPPGVHVAFDSLEIRWATAWRGPRASLAARCRSPMRSSSTTSAPEMPV